MSAVEATPRPDDTIQSVFDGNLRDTTDSVWIITQQTGWDQVATYIESELAERCEQATPETAKAAAL